jgi:NAD/NADP transhydrogenase alpha subunit
LGAIVRAFDSRSVVKEQIESLGAEFVQMDYKEEGAGTGGYGKAMSEEYYKSQRRMILKQAKEVDVIITTALIPNQRAPILITEEIVRAMKNGSVIVDLAAEKGGNCQLTRPGEIYIDNESGVQFLRNCNLNFIFIAF